VPGFLREKIKYIRVCCLDPEYIRISLYQIVEHKVPVYKAQVHWDRKGLNSTLINQSINQCTPGYKIYILSNYNERYLSLIPQKFHYFSL
jgi:hypothetical protein